MIENKQDILELLEQTQAVLKGHFELSSGNHSNQYFQCAKLLQYPKYAELAAKMLAEKFNKDSIDAVVGPALGGVIIGYEVGKAMDKKSIFTERKDGAMTLRRGFELEPGERVIIIEDVITTAKSAIETTKALESLGAKVVGYGCIVDRSCGNTYLDIKSLTQMEPVIYSPDNCPLCRQGSSPEKPGSRFKTL